MHVLKMMPKARLSQGCMDHIEGKRTKIPARLVYNHQQVHSVYVQCTVVQMAEPVNMPARYGVLWTPMVRRLGGVTTDELSLCMPYMMRSAIGKDNMIGARANNATMTPR